MPITDPILVFDHVQQESALWTCIMVMAKPMIWFWQLHTLPAWGLARTFCQSRASLCDTSV